MRSVVPSTPLRTTVVSSAALSTAVLPFFLIGALSLAIRDELGIGETATGALGTVLFVSAAAAATPAGRLVERVGASVALRVGVVLPGLAAAAIGWFAQTWWQLAIPMAVAGCGVAMIDTGAARAFADRVHSGRQGLAFGIKEASIPTASMLAGLSLPTVATWLGWRASFVAALGVAGIILLLIPTPAALRGRTAQATEAAKARPAQRMASPAIVRFAAGIGLGTGAATAGAAFLVPGLVAEGISDRTAGLALALASVASILARLGAGWVADRQGARPVLIVSVLMATGAGAALVLASSAPRPVLVAGAVVLLGAGWGWTGLAFFAVVRANPTTPAAAAGVVLTGLGAGGATGPLAFGALADGASFTVAWLVASGSLVGATALVLTAQAELQPPSPS